ncbi:MAG: hypothetical protein M1826_005833 [Phylliscum demangeonii]|nr:MAG: hypothetical protein M1826_005833 [Phylliscum demangeonii]
MAGPAQFDSPRKQPQRATAPSSARATHVNFPTLSPAKARDESSAHVNHGSPTSQARPRRASSLSSRFPGDMTHRPLEMLKRESKAAHRAPHLRKHHLPGADAIDSLDNILGAYHHEGPYDAALLARNTSFESSPLEAVRASNEKALEATPRELIQDSVERHRPLDGVSSIPPGMTDLAGREMRYEEGANMMIEDGGDYKRWPGVVSIAAAAIARSSTKHHWQEYHANDIKGKGEPSYSLELALKQHREHDHRRVFSDGGVGYEMTSGTRRSTGFGPDDARGAGLSQEHEGCLRRSNTTGRTVRPGWKSRLLKKGRLLI